MTVLFSNNASGTLSVELTSSIADQTIVLQSNEGGLFPNPSSPDFFYVTLEDTAGNVEICQCTARSNDTLTVFRGVDNTIAQAFPVGSKVELRVTNAVLNSFVQTRGDAMTGPLDMNGQEVQDAVLTSGGSGVIQGLPIRGSDNGTANELLVPSGGAAPTIGGNAIVTSADLGTYVPTTRTLTGGQGIAAIGDLSTNRTIDLAVSELTQIEGNALAAADDFLVYDADAAAHKRMAYQDGGIRVTVESGTSRVLTAADMNTYIRCTNGGATTVTLNTGVGTVGNVVIIEQGGAGTVTVNGTATVNTAASSQATRAQYSVIILVCYTANSWTLYGDAS
jgi:hypothetical protein